MLDNAGKGWIVDSRNQVDFGIGPASKFEDRNAMETLRGAEVLTIEAVHPSSNLIREG